MPALEQFRRAVELDPGYALAWAGVADVFTVIAYFGLLPGADAKRHGLAAAKSAIALDANSAEARTAFASATLQYEQDLAMSEQEFVRALELNSNYVQGRCWYALFYLQLARGRFDEGIAQVRLALDTDPLSAYIATILAACLGTAGQHDEAVAAARRAAQLDPASFVARWVLGASLGWAGRYDEAVAVIEESAAMSARHHFAITVSPRFTRARVGITMRRRCTMSPWTARRACTCRAHT
jgi:tetratricopeptide (TPR) repeat protein